MKCNFFSPILSFILFFGIVFAACKDLDRDNNLDPKNPNAEANQVTVVENFVHRYTNYDSVYPSIRYSQVALQQLTADYKERMIIMEYHMYPAGVPANDTFASLENESRYNDYRGSTTRGFPHAFFNGNAAQIQGASSVETAKQRYQTILDSITVKKVKLYCEAEMRYDGDTLIINSRLIRFGTEEINNLLVEFFVVEDKGDLLHYMVRKDVQDEFITSIPAQTIYEMPRKTYMVPPFVNRNDVSVAILIKDAISKRIIQSQKIEG
jgi:hypothetical protein